MRHRESFPGSFCFQDLISLQTAPYLAGNKPSMPKIQTDWHKQGPPDERIFDDCNSTVLLLLQGRPFSWAAMKALLYGRA